MATHTSVYSSLHRPIYARNVVSTSQSLASQAGLAVLRAGGNAVDAAVASAIALTVVEPISNGIGSDLFALVWDGKALQGLNASGRAPMAWTPEYFGGHPIPERGWNSVSVPGAVAAWADLSKRYGKLPFSRLFDDAIHYAEEGFPISPFVAQRWASQIPELRGQPGFNAAFLPQGRAPAEGEIFRLPDQARSLRLIADSEGESFYRGELAQRMSAHAAENGAAFTESDLASHQNDWVQPISHDYRGLRLHELPPNGQGIVALTALGILSHFDLRAMEVDSADSLHVQIEALKLAFADVYRYVADPPAMEIPLEALLDADYLKARAALIDMRRAQDFGHGAPPGGGTVYLAAADAQGMMVSLIQSNYMGFGSGVVVPGTGISLQNRGAGFSVQAGRPNCVAPGKRPFHTIIPGFVTRNGEALMSLGLMGASMQPQGHVQLTVRMADYDQSPQSAIDAPRFRIVEGLQVSFEPALAASTLEQLKARGHVPVTLTDGYTDFGCAQIIQREGSVYLGACDLRRDSLAAGY
ncbi:MAG TPA: gamma-glutamyltransferase family protein [Burkholderiales bacterium]|nr:gamma-glutamyltransferase family protein [Burkholderiales bacterium]